MIIDIIIDTMWKLYKKLKKEKKNNRRRQILLIVQGWKWIIIHMLQRETKQTIHQTNNMGSTNNMISQ